METNQFTFSQYELKSGNQALAVNSYRGFFSIDQEIEREIALQWFSSRGKSSFTTRNFLIEKKEYGNPNQ